jgi:transposase
MPSNRVAGCAASLACCCECGCVTRQPRYPTDLTDRQWAVLEPALPVMLCDTELGGRPERHRRRTMIDAMFYVVDNGIKWRALSADFPPWQTVYGMHARWRKDGVLTTSLTCCAAGYAKTPGATASRRLRSWTPNRCGSPPRAWSQPRPADTTAARRSTAASATC